MANNKNRSTERFPPTLIALMIVTAVLMIAAVIALYAKGGDGVSVDLTERSGADPAESGSDSPNQSGASATAAPETTAADTSGKLFREYDEERDWALYVIGNENPLPEDFTVSTKPVAGERELDERCAEYAIAMLDQAYADNVGLYVTSAYRSVQKQAENMQSYINTLISQGYSEEEAEKQAHAEIAMPGCSEHNAGLAMDIVSDDYWATHTDLDESFEQLPQFDWLISNSWKYGFVLSYPKGKEDITGFIYEPWHFRFVGLEHAEVIHEVYEETGEFLTVNEYISEYCK